MQISYENIVNTKSLKNGIIDYIRNYSTKLDEQKNKFLKKIGLSNMSVYDMEYDSKNLNIILNKIKKELFDEN